MTKYREILRLRSLGFSERNIASSCGVSRNTVAKVTARADELRICWPLDFGMTDSALEAIMFPKEKSTTNKRIPDYDYIRKELLRNKLIEMRLTAMADAFRIQMNDSSVKDISFEDRFGMLVDIEYTNRKNNRLKRLIKNAELEQPDASIAAIDYTSGR